MGAPSGCHSGRTPLERLTAILGDIATRIELRVVSETEAGVFTVSVTEDADEVAVDDEDAAA